MHKPTVSLTLTLVTAALLCASAAFAQEQVDEQRLGNQQQRINTGVSNGTINPAVAAHDERGINRDQDRLKFDENHGGLNANEQRRINRSENRHSRHIRHQRLVNPK